MIRRRPFVRRRRGQGLIEFALVIPLVVLLVAGLIDLARVIHAQQTLERLAREVSSRATQASESGVAASRADIEALIRGATLPPLDPARVRIEEVRSDDRDATGIASFSIRVTYELAPVTPLLEGALPGGTIRISSAAQLPYSRQPLSDPERSGGRPPPPPDYQLDQGTLITRVPLAVKVKLLGDSRRRGPDLAIDYTRNGTDFVPGLRHARPGEDDEFLVDLAAGDAFALAIRSAPSGRHPGSTHVTNRPRPFENDPTRFREVVLAAGDDLPDVRAFSGDVPAPDYLARHLDLAGRRARLGEREFLSLVEFSSRFDATDTDYLDAVVVIQVFDATGEPPPRDP